MSTAGQQGDRLQLCGKNDSHHESPDIKSQVRSFTTISDEVAARWLFAVANQLGSEVSMVTTLYFRRKMETAFF